MISRTRSEWKKFRDLLSVLTCRGFSFHSKGRVYKTRVRSVLLYGSETWAVKKADFHGLEHNNMRMISCMCNVTLKDRKPSFRTEGAFWP